MIRKSKKILPLVGIKKYLKGKKDIFDVGTGPVGSDWWSQVDTDAQITGVDLYFFPKKVPSNVNIYKFDASNLGQIEQIQALEQVHPKSFIFKKKKVKWTDRFDMIVANHILEHVSSPKKVIEGMSKLIKKGGIVYAGFPDSNNFTDIFYHLVHPNGGGHIQLLSREEVIELFKANGFRLVSTRMWPDSWEWLRKQYNWKSYMWPDNQYLTQKKIDYLCNTFIKELTLEKGYFYGWELVFEKK